MNKQIRYFHYCLWARELLKAEVGPENAHFSYPASVLAYIRLVAPGNVVGEIKDDTFDVTMDVFCKSLGLGIPLSE